MCLAAWRAAKDIAATILERDVPICADGPMRGTLPAGLYPGVEGDVGISVSVRTKKPFSETLSVIPRALTLGLGCRRGTAKQALAPNRF